MKRRITCLVLYIVVGLLFWGCEIQSLIKENVETYYPFDTLRVVNVKNDIHVVFIQDSLNFINMIAPEKFQDKIEPKIKGDTIILQNTNGSSLINRYSYDVIAEIHFKSLYYLFYQGGGSITNKDTIRLKTFKLSTNGSNGNVRLQMDAGNINLGLSTGSSVFEINGKCESLSVWSTSYCVPKLFGLDADRVLVNNNSAVDFFVSYKSSLISNVNYKGNVYYKGDPVNVTVQGTGSGKTIHMDE